jgi:hypothetical protein
VESPRTVGGRYALIATILPSRATGKTKAYRALRQVSGSDLVAKVIQVFSLRPASMRRMIRSWELAMWTGDEPRAQRELIIPGRRAT